MKTTLSTIIAGIAFCTLSLPVLAFPSKPVTLIVPTAPGGGNDAMARAIGQKMAVLLNQPVIVDNKPGANGAIAAEFVAKAPADGHTIMFGYVATHAINPALQKLRYDPVKDFEAIGMVGSSPVIMVTNPSVPAKSLAEFISYARVNTGKLNYASAGSGTAPHIAGELFAKNAKVSLVHVPYKGSAPAVTDLLGGTVQVMFPSLFTAYPYVKAGRLQALGVAGGTRAKVLPALPTLGEQGLNGIDVAQWYRVFAPANTPSQVLSTLNAALNKALADPAIIKKLEDQGLEVKTSTPAALKAYVTDEVVRWKKLLGDLKIQLD